MSKVKIRPYCSPTLVLLAFDWPDGDRRDFLGFAILRSPGFRKPDGTEEAESWLPNRIGFDGPEQGRDFPSETCPIQKFQWWDARVDDPDRGREFTYRIWPVVGTPENLQRVAEAEGRLTITIPRPEERGIATYFNRAVVSSQAFSSRFGDDLSEDELPRALGWLANGLETAIPSFLGDNTQTDGAIYHLTDMMWVVPALRKAGGEISLVFNQTKKDDANASVVEEVGQLEGFTLKPRTRAKIMHNKFLVRREEGKPVAVLTGSANFTTDGLTTQANVLHVFRSPKLARIYLERKELLEEDPTIGATAKEAGWSEPVRAGDAKVSVFFPPEPKGTRESLDRVVRAVKRAKRSVLFCLFSPTDRELRNACFEAGDRGRMMFGVVNTISEREPEGEARDPAGEAKVELYHRSRRNRDVFSHSLFSERAAPEGFWFETRTLPGRGGRFPVFIHHKFVIVDAETDEPTIFTGSANMSKSSLYNNDENLLEITESPRLARMYLAEFMRLYEHYRARAIWKRFMEGRVRTFKLRGDSGWTGRAYTRGTPEFRSRVSMVGG
jgi:PLD-like domain